MIACDSMRIDAMADGLFLDLSPLTNGARVTLGSLALLIDVVGADAL